MAAPDKDTNAPFTFASEPAIDAPAPESTASEPTLYSPAPFTSSSAPYSYSHAPFTSLPETAIDVDAPFTSLSEPAIDVDAPRSSVSKPTAHFHAPEGISSESTAYSDAPFDRRLSPFLTGDYAQTARSAGREAEDKNRPLSSRPPSFPRLPVSLDDGDAGAGLRQAPGCAGRRHQPTTPAPRRAGERRGL